MTRLPPQVSLVVAFLVLTSAATAYAECAWVVWTETIRKADIGKTDVLWEIYATYKTQEECEKYKPFEPQDPRLPENLAKLQTQQRALMNILSERVLCLPDTVDPRGPKGGGR